MKDNSSYHLHSLEALAAADKALAYAGTLEFDGPTQLKQLDKNWFEQVFSTTTTAAKLESIDVVDSHDGMTCRQKIKLNWHSENAATGLPTSIFLKATPPTGHLRETLAMLHMHELETRFYTELQPELTHIAPKAFYAKAYAGGNFLMALEDIETLGYTPYWQADVVGLDHVKAVTIALASLHARYWESERLEQDLHWVRPRTRRLGWTWLRDSFTKARAEYLKTAPEELLVNGAADALSFWNTHASETFDQWEQLPSTVLHGDSHLGNTFSRPDGSAGLFDWQVMFRGNGLRDLCYFNFSAMDNQTRVQHEAAIFDVYLDALVEHGGPILNREQAWNDYCLFAFDYWDAGIKAYIYGYGHANEGTVRGLKSCIGSITDNDSLTRLKVALAN